MRSYVPRAHVCIYMWVGLYMHVNMCADMCIHVRIDVRKTHEQLSTYACRRLCVRVHAPFSSTIVDVIIITVYIICH